MYFVSCSYSALTNSVLITSVHPGAPKSSSGTRSREFIEFRNENIAAYFSNIKPVVCSFKIKIELVLRFSICGWPAKRRALLMVAIKA